MAGPCLFPQALIITATGTRASIRMFSNWMSSTKVPLAGVYLEHIWMPVEVSRMMQLEITALRTVPGPTPIRNALQVVRRMQLVMVTYSQGRLTFSRLSFPRKVMQSSPLSMMQSLTVPKRQQSMSRPSPFGGFYWVQMRMPVT